MANNTTKAAEDDGKAFLDKMLPLNGVSGSRKRQDGMWR